MTEQQVERRIMDKIAAALDAAAVTGVRVFGAWQVADAGEAKAVEKPGWRGLLSVKVAPREYATPTVPHATLDVSVALDMRAESDARGATRLAAAEAVALLLIDWQDDFAAFAAAFGGIDGFTPCGFRLAGGDVGLDRTSTVWSWRQNFTIHAIIRKGATS